MSKEGAVADQLREAGYALVQVEPRVPSLSSSRPDVVAWAADADGVLVPWAVVEVKSGSGTLPGPALTQLATYRDQLGTADHYVVLNGEWFRADASLRRVEPVSGPSRPPFGSRGAVHDVSLATALVSERLWRDQRHRTEGRPEGRLELFLAAVGELRNGLLVTRPGEKIPAEKSVLWHAGRRALTAFAGRDVTSGPHLSHPTVASAVAQLAGERLSRRVFDPFCGAGEFLWAAADRAAVMGRDVSLSGLDVSTEMVEIASALASVAPYPARIERGDAFNTDVPTADLVVSAPPMRLRLEEPEQLMDGNGTMDGDVAAIDVALRSLRPGGRAVLHVGPGFTFRSAARDYREFLAEHFRLGALIGCPSGSVPGTGRGSVLMVIDKSPPTETFVAQLGDDWEEELAGGGAVMQAASSHLDGIPSSGSI